MTFAERYGPWAVVTGAAQGMGASFAAELRRRGVDVIAVDRDGAALADQAAGIGATAVVADLAEPAGADAVIAATEGKDVGLLISNAAISWVGPFVEQPRDVAVAQLDVNCRSPLVLVHALLPHMVARGRGGVMLLSSGSAWRGSPLVAVYAATKAWNLVLAESLWDELSPAGVDVMAVVPGSTRTPGFMASMPQASLGTATLMEADDVAVEALDALGSGPSFTPGQANRDSEQFMASMDRTEAIRMMGQVMREMYPPVRTADPSI